MIAAVVLDVDVAAVEQFVGERALTIPSAAGRCISIRAIGRRRNACLAV